MFSIHDALFLLKKPFITSYTPSLGKIPKLLYT